MAEGISPEDVRAAVEAIAASGGFSGAPKLQRFLRHVVERTLAGRADEIKEPVIGVEVYQKPVAYDPRTDATVRVEAAKLRHRLEQYYAEADAEILITIPKGSYVPRFERRLQQPPAAAAVPPETRLIQPAPAFWNRGLVALLLLSGVLLGWVARRPGTNEAVTGADRRLTQLTALGSFAAEPDLSADGSFLVYASDAGTPSVLNLWRQPVGGGSAVPVTRGASSARTPSISADGKQVAFRLEETGGLLALVSAQGGEIERLTSARRGRHPRFAPTGRLLAYWVPQDEQTLDHGSVYLIDPQDPGKAPQRVFGEFAHAATPVWSRGGGRHLLAVGTWESGVAEREYDAWTLEVAAGQGSGGPRKTGLFPLLAQRGLYRSVAERSEVSIGDWRDGWIYFSAPNGDGRNLYRVRLRPGEGVSGEPEPVTIAAGSNTGARAASHDRLVFANALISYNLHSAALTPGVEVQCLTRAQGINMRPSIDRSGRQAGWERRRSANSGNQLWAEDLVTGSTRELGTSAPSNRAHVLIAPDGRAAAYQVLEGTRQAIYLETLADGRARRICDDCGIPVDWNDGGSHLLYITGGRPNGVGLLEVATGKYSDLLNHPSYGLYGARYRIGPAGDGWMTLYADTGPRTRQIFLAPVKNYRPADYQRWIPVTDGAHWDLSPAWGPGGQSIFFVSQRDGYRCIWMQALDPATNTPTGDPQAVHHFHSPERTLMQSIPNRGADSIWVASGKLFFFMDQTTSSLWMRE